MADKITLRIITPERIALDTTASSVCFPALDGQMGVLPRHAPMVAALDAGLLTYESEDGHAEMFVSGGFAEVRDNTVRVVTQASERPEEIDADRAHEAEERARERLHVRKSEGEPLDMLRAEAALHRALVRLRVSQRGA